MKRVMLTVAYDGTAYSGWQLQPQAETIESVLNRCLSELTGETVEVIGASRTDSGVHALGNVAVFDTESPIPADKFSYALNRMLPQDIRIRGSREVTADFHPRHCESIKTYEYRICNAEFPLPTKRLYAHFTYVPLDVSLMKQAAAYLVGEHDFKSFCSVDTQAKTTVRKIEEIAVWEVPMIGDGITGEKTESDGAFREVFAKEKEKGGTLDFGEREIIIRVRGRGFLYNMVRIIAGTLMEVGRGQLLPERMEEILLACDRQKAGPTAPACGLTLIGYEFLEKPVDTRGAV